MALIDTVYRTLVGLAKDGKPCPRTDDLALMCGCDTYDINRNLSTQQKARRISYRSVTSASGYVRRVVTITALDIQTSEDFDGGTRCGKNGPGQRAFGEVITAMLPPDIAPIATPAHRYTPRSFTERTEAEFYSWAGGYDKAGEAVRQTAAYKERAARLRCAREERLAFTAGRRMG